MKKCNMSTDLFQYLWSDENDLKVVASKDVCIINKIEVSCNPEWSCNI